MSASTIQPEVIDLLNEVGAVLSQHGLRPDLQQALRLAVALTQKNDALSEETKQVKAEREKFEAWFAKKYPERPVTGHDAQLLWSGWIGRSNQVQHGIFLSAEKLRQVELILDAKLCERFDGYNGEGGGVYRDKDGDYIDIDDAQARMDMALAEIKSCQ